MCHRLHPLRKFYFKLYRYYLADYATTLYKCHRIPRKACIHNLSSVFHPVLKLNVILLTWTVRLVTSKVLIILQWFAINFHKVGFGELVSSLNSLNSCDSASRTVTAFSLTFYSMPSIDLISLISLSSVSMSILFCACSSL